MDCKTARLLLHFAHPQASELEAEEASALETHLDRCSDCHRLARGERQIDGCLGKAMQQVQPPTGLRDQLLARLEADRGDWYRRRFAHSIRMAATAAAVLVLAWAGWHWLANRSKASIDLGQVIEAFNKNAAEDRQTIAGETLKGMGVEGPLSPNLNYNLLSAPPSLADLPGYPGQRVPMLVFDHAPRRRAVVYLVASEQLQLPRGVPLTVGGATYKLEVLPLAGEPYTYLVIHDGDNLDWLRPLEPPPT
jgi:hypothetical protein